MDEAELDEKLETALAKIRGEGCRVKDSGVYLLVELIRADRPRIAERLVSTLHLETFRSAPLEVEEIDVALMAQGAQTLGWDEWRAWARYLVAIVQTGDHATLRRGEALLRERLTC